MSIDSQQPDVLDAEIEVLVGEWYSTSEDVHATAADRRALQQDIRALVLRREREARQQPRENIAGGDACPHCGRSWTQQPAKQWPSGEQGR